MFDTFCLKILDLNDNTHEVYCFGYAHTVEYIKFALSQTTKIDKKNILLYMNNRELVDSKTFREYGINENSKIRMFFRIKSGFRS